MGEVVGKGWRAAGCSAGLGLHWQGLERLAAGSGRQRARCCVGSEGGDFCLGEMQARYTRWSRGNNVK